MLMEAKKDKAKTSIAIVALCDGYSLNEFKIAIQRSVGSRVTTMKEVDITRDGMNCTPGRYLKEMFETSGQKVIEAHTATGDDHVQKSILDKA